MGRVKPIKDTVPPVVLGKQQLAELNKLNIVDKGRRSVRIYRGGALSEIQISIIATKLAKAGVQEARFYSEAYHLLENWTDQLHRIKVQAETGKAPWLRSRLR
jgi:putative DNA primase/helicase